MIQVGRYNLTDLLTVEFRKLMKEPYDYMKYCYQMFPYLNSSKLSKDELITGGILDLWIE